MKDDSQGRARKMFAKWRFGALGVFAAVLLTGCAGGGQTRAPVCADAATLETLQREVYNADVAAQTARNALAQLCRGNYSEIMSDTCGEKGRKEELFKLGQACKTAIDNYNKARGKQPRIEMHESKRPSLQGGIDGTPITCGYDPQ